MNKNYKIACVLSSFALLAMVKPALWVFSVLFSAIFLIITFFARKKAVVSFWSCIALVISFYVFTCFTTENKAPLQPGPFHAHYPTYDLLMEGFLKGQLSLNLEPEPELIALADPYKPENRKGISWSWDASYYKGKYYSYFGITPLATVYYPAYALTGKFVRAYFVCLIFMSLAFLFAALTLRRLLRDVFLIEPDSTDYFLLLVTLGVSSSYAYIARRPAVYEIAIFSGAAFGLASLYFHLKAVLGSIRPRLNLVFSGICFGLAVGSRPTWLFLGLAHVLILNRHQWKNFFAFIIPASVLGAMLATYNYLRFESFTEFGLHYQMEMFDMREWGMHWKSFIKAILAYSFNVPRVHQQFPYFELQHNVKALGNIFHYYFSDPVIGLFSGTPIALSLGLLFNKKIRSQLPLFSKRLFIAIGVTVICFFAIDCMTSIIQRYVADYILLVLLIVLSLYFWWVPRSQKPQRNYLVGTFLMVFGFCVHFFSSFEGLENWFKRNQPQIYEGLRLFF